MGADDEPALHAEDTISAGRGLSRPSAVSVLASEAAARVADLVDLGVEFDPGLGLEGGHSRARVVHAGGAARTPDRSRARRAGGRPARISVLEGERALGSGRLALAASASRRTAARSPRARHCWRRVARPHSGSGRRTPSAPSATGSRWPIAREPASLISSSSSSTRLLCRAAGSPQRGSAGGRRPSARRERPSLHRRLAPRDVVAREVGARATALLDLRPVDRERFPSVIGSLEDAALTRRRAGSRGARGPLHDGWRRHGSRRRTELPGLYAAGECACTGVHGANRLASNRPRCLVFGRRAALASVAEPELPVGRARHRWRHPKRRSRRLYAGRCGGTLVSPRRGGARAPPPRRHLLTRLIAESALARTKAEERISAQTGQTRIRISPATSSSDRGRSPARIMS